MGDISLLSVLPFLTPFGAVVVLMGIIYRDPIKEWLGGSKKVSEAMNRLDGHIEREEKYWSASEQRLCDLEARLKTQELTSVEFRITLQKNHEETILMLGEMNKRLGEMNVSIIRTHERIDRHLGEK